MRIRTFALAVPWVVACIGCGAAEPQGSAMAPAAEVSLPAGVLAPSASTTAPAPPTAICPLDDIRITAPREPALSGGTPKPGAAPVEDMIVRVDQDGAVFLGIAPSEPAFRLDESGCLTFQGKLAAEILDDGRIVSEAGVLQGTRKGATLTLANEVVMTIGADGTIVTTMPPPLASNWRAEGFRAGGECAVMMALVAMARSFEGVSMAVIDGVAQRPQPSPPPPGSRCANYPRQ